MLENIWMSANNDRNYHKNLQQRQRGRRIIQWSQISAAFLCVRAFCEMMYGRDYIKMLPAK